MNGLLDHPVRSLFAGLAVAALPFVGRAFTGPVDPGLPVASRRLPTEMRSPLRFWPELSCSQGRFEPLSSRSPGRPSRKHGKREVAESGAML